jgi:hypothetical protein
MSMSEDTAAKWHLVSQFWSLVLSDGSDYPRSLEEIAWLDLVGSEPSLLLSTIAIGLRHWSPNVIYQEMAHAYWSRATTNMIQHISDGWVCTDAVLAAVGTMAFGERLLHNDDAWIVHIEGLAEMIRYRRSCGSAELPEWLYDILIMLVTPYSSPAY